VALKKRYDADQIILVSLWIWDFELPNYTNIISKCLSMKAITMAFL